jgi:hypothetical protein
MVFYSGLSSRGVMCFEIGLSFERLKGYCVLSCVFVLAYVWMIEDGK